MPNFHRFYLSNSIVFITNVTKNRKPIFASEENIQIYRQTLQTLKEVYSFFLLAYVLLPDHFHWLIQIREENGNFSKVMRSFKRGFTIRYKQHHAIVHPISIWQPRFWDHVIRNEKDLERHFDYIHWNPVKHGYVKDAQDWQNSSFDYWYGENYYKPGWGEMMPENIRGMDFE